MLSAIDWFCGIGGFRLALDRQNFHTAASCEISPFPRKVYETHFGAPPTYEDVTRVQPEDLPRADLWVGGFPCQDVSAAGAGLGLLAGKRSSLVFRLLGLAARARPQWILLENTPGLLFRGRGYGRLLGVLARLGYGFAWRRLDAQYFGVAQRRKRIFLLACLGARAGQRRAAEVLLEPESVRGDPPPRREAGQEVARPLASGAQGSSGYRANGGEETLVWSECLAEPLTATNARLCCHAGNNPKARNVVAYVIPSGGSRQTKAPETEIGAWGRGAGGTLVIPFSAAQVTHPENRAACTPGSPAGTLASSGEPESIAVVERRGASGRAREGAALSPPKNQRTRYVRRLTPRECERLQGFPDDWTLIEGGSDAARYRALGNAVAVPVVEWILKRLREHA